MNCEDALCLISGHIDGQNTAEEEALLQAHLESCASCREILQAYQAVDQGVAALEEEPPQGLAEAVMEQILQHPSQRSHRRRLFLGSGTAVAAVAAVLALLLFTGRLPNLNQSRASTVHPADDAAAGLQTEGIQEASTEADASDAVPKASRAQAQPEDAAADPSSGEAAGGSAPANSGTAQDGAAVSPMMVTASPEKADSTLRLEVTDNPDAPAADTISELAGMPAEDAEAGRSVQYWTDVQTARKIADSYSTLYLIAVPDALEEAEDTAPCAILVLEP